MGYIDESGRAGEDYSTETNEGEKKKGRTICKVMLVLVACYLLYRTIFFVNEVRHFVAVYNKAENRFVYNNAKYVKTPISSKTYDIGKKLGTIRGRTSDWPLIFFLHFARFDGVYSVEGEEEERLLVVKRLGFPILYCRKDIKEKLKKKGEYWNFAVGDVTKLRMESDKEGPFFITDPEQIAYLEKAMNAKGRSLADGRSETGPTWRTYYYYQDLPLYDYGEGIIEDLNLDGIYWIRVFDGDTGEEVLYEFKDDGRMYDIFRSIRGKK